MVTHKSKTYRGKFMYLACGYQPENHWPVKKSARWCDVTCKNCLRTRKVTTGKGADNE